MEPIKNIIFFALILIQKNEKKYLDNKCHYNINDSDDVELYFHDRYIQYPYKILIDYA